MYFILSNYYYFRPRGYEAVGSQRNTTVTTEAVLLFFGVIM